MPLSCVQVSRSRGKSGVLPRYLILQSDAADSRNIAVTRLRRTAKPDPPTNPVMEHGEMRRKSKHEATGAHTVTTAAHLGSTANGTAVAAAIYSHVLAMAMALNFDSDASFEQRYVEVISIGPGSMLLIWEC